jgi:hypothetical protein
MNPLMKIVKPAPQPAYALLTVIFVGFGAVLYPRAGFKVAAVFFVIAAILAIKFIRGLMIESQLMKIGIRAEGRVLRVEQRQFHERGMPQSQVWRITFTYTDAMGVPHEQWVDEFDEETAKGYEKPGAVVNIRYHPDSPDQFRWLD